MAKKKRTEPFVMLHRRVIDSFAWRALSESARKVIDRVILEWMAHAGKLSTDIPVTKENFIEYGLHHNAIAPAQREACALGLLLLSTRGRAPHCAVAQRRGSTAAQQQQQQQRWKVRPW